MKDAVDNKRLDYIMAPLVMQADLRKARQEIDRLPRLHADHKAWHPGLALGPYWLPDIKHKAEDTRVAIGPGAWGDDDAGASWDDYKLLGRWYMEAPMVELLVARPRRRPRLPMEHWRSW